VCCCLDTRVAWVKIATTVVIIGDVVPMGAAILPMIVSSDGVRGKGMLLVLSLSLKGRWIRRWNLLPVRILGRSWKHLCLASPFTFAEWSCTWRFPMPAAVVLFFSTRLLHTAEWVPTACPTFAMVLLYVALLASIVLWPPPLAPAEVYWYQEIFIEIYISCQYN